MDNEYLAAMLEEPSIGKDHIILHLINKSYNVNIPNKYGQTLLHKAVSNCSVKIVHKLIKSGACVNAQDENGSTPLHEAVRGNNSEIICMLLYYKADATILNFKGYCPFVESLNNCVYCYNLEMASWLLNYYSNFPGKFALYSTYLNLFRNPMQEEEMLGVIRQIWDKFDHNTMLRDKSMFLSLYLLESLFSIPAWIDCLCSMLNTPNVAELMKYQFGILDKYSESNFLDVICALLTRNVRRDGRLTVISLWLNFGAEICIDDIRKVVHHYQINEEAMLLMSSAPVPILALLFALEEHMGTKTYKTFQSVIIFELICGVCRANTFKIALGLICKSLTYFSWNNVQRLMIADQLAYTEHCKTVMNIMDKLPKVPSLVELCRNKVVRRIQRNVVPVKRREMLNPIKFHAAINCLDVTHHVKDILHFKTPLYG